MSKNKINEEVSEILSDFLNESDMELYYSEFVKEGPDRILRIYIDRREGYINTDDCETVSRFLSDKLDERDLIDTNYMLEVSSPGLDRVLVKEEHFERYIDNQIQVSLFREINGSKKIEGILKKYVDGDIKVALETGEEIMIESKNIAKVNLAVII